MFYNVFTAKYEPSALASANSIHNHVYITQGV